MIAIPVAAMQGRAWWIASFQAFMEWLGVAWERYLTPGLPADRKAQAVKMQEYQAVIDRWLP